MHQITSSRNSCSLFNKKNQQLPISLRFRSTKLSWSQIPKLDFNIFQSLQHSEIPSQTLWPTPRSLVISIANTRIEIAPPIPNKHFIDYYVIVASFLIIIQFNSHKLVPILLMIFHPFPIPNLENGNSRWLEITFQSCRYIPEKCTACWSPSIAIGKHDKIRRSEFWQHPEVTKAKQQLSKSKRKFKIHKLPKQISSWIRK